MDAKSLELLEFPEVKKIIAGFTSFSASRELALDLHPLTDSGKISLLLKQSAEARRLLSVELNFSIGGITDIRGMVGLAARGKTLEPQELLDVLQSITALRQLRTNLSRISTDFPLLWNIVTPIQEFRELEKNILSAISPTGEVMDSASAKLGAIRRQLREVRQQLVGKLEGLMNTTRGRKLVQEPLITERDGRYYARLTGPQGSGILTSMSLANALVIVPEDKGRLEAGETAQVLMLDWIKE